MSELTDDDLKTFQGLSHQYSQAIQQMNNFIEAKNLDYDEAWDAANQQADAEIISKTTREND
ncbi:hypothetical protein [Sinobaca sp. H24]|uniref:hypothetical protein n=1 Tax=Sinobaca sp. H24 TaxID=2923376 RepID=UPI0020797203|nr:hypothetical protein [Sinobaca sp. H24]